VDHEPDAVRVQSPFTRPREPRILVAVIAAFLLIALVKPWSFGENRSASGRSGSGTAIPSGGGLAIDGEASLATPAIQDPNAMPCLSNAQEQVVIIERWAGHEVRSWVAATDIIVSGPLDERLVPISVFSTHVVGLGVCGPRARIGTQQPAAKILDVQGMVHTDSGPVAVDLGRPDPITLELSGQDPARLYGAPLAAPPSSSVSPPRVDPGADPTPTEQPRRIPASDTGLPSPDGGWTTWPTGSFAIAFRFQADGSNVIRWLRLDLIQGAGSS
jgi:hypothetical protein